MTEVKDSTLSALGERVFPLTEGAASVGKLGAMALMGIGWVKIKMLPFDNKSEFQIILNTPDGSTLEDTTQRAREMAGRHVRHAQGLSRRAVPQRERKRAIGKIVDGGVFASSGGAAYRDRLHRW